MFARAALAFSLCAGFAAAQQTQAFTWKSVNIQGMGYVTGLISHPAPPHDIYIRTDVGGAYRLDRATQRWIPLTDRYPSELAGILGVESIAADPSDAATVYIATGYANGAGEVLVSNSRGAHWKPTGLAAHGIYVGPNEAARGMTGERLAVDPHKPSRLYFGSRRQGLWMYDSGTWSHAGGGFPEAPAQFGVTFVLCDASSGKAANGATARVYAGVYGDAVWTSGDGGVSWTSAGGPKYPLRAALAGDGTLFVTSGGDEGGNDAAGKPVPGSVQRFRGGSWKDITPQIGQASWSGISIAPGNPYTVYAAANSNLRIYRSTDAGDSWAAVPVPSLANQPPYYVKPKPSNYNTRTGSWGNAALTVDLARPTRIYQTNGYGVIKTDDATAATPAWTWLMDNLEELCVQSVRVPPLEKVPSTGEPGAHLMSVSMDMVGMRHAHRDQPPLATMADFPWVAQATSIAYSAGHPEYAAFVGWDEAASTKPVTGFSSNNGLAWTPFKDTTPGVAGAIALSSADPLNMVWAPANSAVPVFTKNGGETWEKCRLGGGLLPGAWAASNTWWSSQVVAADAVEGNRFYYYNQGEFYTSTDGGANWTRTATLNSPEQSVLWTVRVNVVPNPVKAGDVWIALQHNENQPKLFKLFHSSNYGASFEALPGVDGANYVAFGKGKAGGPPYMYIHGRVGGATYDAIYKSEDSGATWIRITDPSQQQFCTARTLEGDMRTTDLVYVGTGCRGIFYGFGPGSGISQPSFPPEGITNAASFQYNGKVAPGELVTIFGMDVGAPELAWVSTDESGSISTVAGDTQVLFDGIPATMIYSLGQQVSAIAPYWLEGRESTSVQVSYKGALSAPVQAQVVSAAPGIYTLAGGRGQVVATNILADGTRELNSASKPAPKGAYLEFYVTGEGQTRPAGLDGRVPATAGYPAPARDVVVKIGGVESTKAECPYNWAGLVYGGVVQINACVPAAAPAGPEAPLEVTVGGVPAQAGATVAIL